MNKVRLISGNRIVVFSYILLCLSLLSDTSLGAGLTFSGQQIQGSLVQGRAVPGARVEVDGEPVRAPADGVVTLAHPDMFYSGVTVIIDHGHHLTSSFLHLNKALVKEGDRVKRGDVIAEVGKTGRVTGAHLDWRMNLRKVRIDPQLLAGPMPEGNDARKNPE